MPNWYKVKYGFGQIESGRQAYKDYRRSEDRFNKRYGTSWKRYRGNPNRRWKANYRQRLRWYNSTNTDYLDKY